METDFQPSYVAKAVAAEMVRGHRYEPVRLERKITFHSIVNSIARLFR